MEGMFYNCKVLSSLDISEFITSNVINISFMFYSTKFNQLDLSHFNTCNVQNMISIFAGCNDLRILNVSNWDFSKVTHIISIFHDVPNLNSIIMKNANIYNISNVSNIFSNFKSFILKYSPSHLSSCSLMSILYISMMSW